MTAPSVSSTRPVAELDRRFYAFAVDRSIAWGIDGAAAVAAWFLLIEPGRTVAGIAVILAVVVLVGLAFALLLGLRGTSPGKATVGIRVVREDGGTPIGVAPAILRQLILGLAGIPTFGLGAATLAWTAVADPTGRRRGWHDHVTHSVVVDVRPAPVEEVVEDAGPRHIVNLTAMRLVPAPPAPPVTPPSRSPRPPAGPPASAPPASPPVPAPVATSAVEPEHAASVPEARPAARQQLGYPLVPEPEPEPAPRPRWRVTFDSGETFLVEGLALVGRRPEASPGETVRHLVALRSGDMSLSKTHAQFQVAADGVLVVMDRGSTNGSILIRQGVPRELTNGKPATMVDGDLVRFGDREMAVVRES